MSLIFGGKRSECFSFKKNEPVISIIIVTMNAEKYVENCLKHLSSQDFQNIELIIFDGNSIDKTVELLRKHEKMISYWQSEPDEGVYDAMNKALKKATGDWYYFLGIDDVLMQGFSEMANRLVDKNTMYIGNTITTKNEFLDGRFTNYKIAKMNISHQSIFYPAMVFEKYQYQTKYKIYADYALNLECWADSAIKKKHYPYLICHYYSFGLSHFNKDEVFENEKELLLKKLKMNIFEILRYRFKQWKRRNKNKTP